jgi:hypothetical protein
MSAETANLNTITLEQYIPMHQCVGLRNEAISASNGEQIKLEFIIRRMYRELCLADGEATGK